MPNARETAEQETKAVMDVYERMKEVLRQKGFNDAALGIDIWDAYKVMTGRTHELMRGAELRRDSGGDGVDDTQAANYPTERVAAVHAATMNAIQKGPTCEDE